MIDDDISTLKDSNISIALIGGSVGGGGVVLLIALIVLIVCLAHRRRRRHRDKHSVGKRSLDMQSKICFCRSIV